MVIDALELRREAPALLEAAADTLLATLTEPMQDSSLAFCVADATRQGFPLVHVNDAFVALTGYPPEAVLGRNCRFLQGPDTDPGAVTALAMALAAGRPARRILRNYRRDGTAFLNEVMLTPIRDEAGRLRFITGTQRRAEPQPAPTPPHPGPAARGPAPAGGLASREAAALRLDLALSAARRGGTACGVVRIDLLRAVEADGGDARLAATARRLLGALRVGDTAAWLGGEAFLVVLPGLPGRAVLRAAASRLRAAIGGLDDPDPVGVPLALRLGAALFPEDAEDSDALVAAAEADLLADGPAASVAPATPTLLAAPPVAAAPDRAARAYIAEELRTGLDQHEFEAVFQPQLRLPDRRLIGLETLLRWRHPRLGLLSPAAFLAVAEQTSLAADLGARALELAAAAAARWAAAGLETGPIAVNLAPGQFSEPGLAASIGAILRRHGLAPPSLTVEVTEALLHGPQAAPVAAALVALRRLGVGIDLDDFGTGYASLTQLRTFPVDRIKIDQGFVAEIGIDPEREATIVGALHAARSLGLRAIAEGVETEAQLAFLDRHGCEAAQGFLLGRPMHEAAATAWINAQAG